MSETINKLSGRKIWFPENMSLKQMRELKAVVTEFSGISDWEFKANILGMTFSSPTNGDHYGDITHFMDTDVMFYHRHEHKEIDLPFLLGYEPLKELKCYGCGVEEGKQHEPGCDHERCPFCGGQLISCNCRYKLLGYDHKNLPHDIYHNGLSDEDTIKFENILAAKGYIPWINYPVICGRCGVNWPNLFMVPDDEWQRNIQWNQRHKVICETCYTDIKNKIDTKGIKNDN